MLKLPKRLRKRVDSGSIGVSRAIVDTFNYHHKGVITENIEKYVLNTGRYTLPLQSLMLLDLIIILGVSIGARYLMLQFGIINVTGLFLFLFAIYGIGQLKCNDLVDHATLYRAFVKVHEQNPKELMMSMFGEHSIDPDTF